MFPERHDYYFRLENTHHHAGEFQNYLEEFGRCLLDNRTARPDLYEGVVTVGVMTAMEECLRTGQPVQLEPWLSAHGIGLGGNLKH